MFWITFIVTGLTVASIPWISRQFSNTVAGLILLLPVMFTASIIVQYLANGEKATMDMMKASLLGYPTLLVFLGVGLILFNKHYSLSLVIGVSLLAWLVSALIVNAFLAR